MSFRSTLVGLSVLAASGLFTLSHAQTAAPAASGTMQMSSSEMTDGEVRNIDKETKKITLKHGEIKNLEMPGMTMVFQVKDPAMLDMVNQLSCIDPRPFIGSELVAIREVRVCEDIDGARRAVAAIA